MSVSKALKSKGSSESPDAAAEEEDEDEEEESEREASRAALPPFLYVGGVLLKGRMEGVWCTVVATSDGLETAVVSLVDVRRKSVDAV
jgi:hypothetical protein